MNISKQTNTLWSQLLEAAQRSTHPEAYRLTEWDALKLRQLLRDESAAERAHRRGRPGSCPLSVADAARVIVLSNIAEGAQRESFDATVFLTWRASAAMARLFGHVLRADLSPEWITAAAALDYSGLMKG